MNSDPKPAAIRNHCESWTLVATPTGDGSQQKPGRDAGELDDRFVLHAQAVPELDGLVDRDDHEQLQGQQGRDDQGGRKQHRGRGPGGAYRQLPRGHWAQAFRDVSAIGLHIQGVVDQVDAGGGHGEGDECDQHLGEGFWLGDDPGGERCGQDQDVLDPLAGPARPEQNWHRGKAWLAQPAHDPATALAGATQRPIAAPNSAPDRTSLG